MDVEKKYFAFISYKREDEKWAKWLQHKLEHYRFPTNLNGRTDLPKSVRPTFRDVTDLKPGFLAEEISNALNDSQWLIIVCSPRSAKSPWVCKEARTFIEQGRADHIIPFVVEGIPFSGDEKTECYPEALLELTGRQELLAANINEVGRDAALVKVISCMFNIQFDTLWQRHTREQKKRRMFWGAVAAFIVIVSVLISGWFYKANNEISRQKTQIDNQYHELVDKQDNLLITQSRYLISEAQKEYDNGNITKALRLALYALPKNLENPDRPYVVEAEAMLRDCDMYNLTINDYLSKKTILYHKSSVSTIDLSSDGRYAVTNSADCAVRIWDIQTGKLSTKPLWHDTTVNSAMLSPDCKYVLTSCNDGFVRVWNAKTATEFGPPIYINSTVSNAQFTPDGKYILTMSEDFVIRVYDFVTRKLLKEVSKHIGTIFDFRISNDGKSFVTASCDSTAVVWNTNGLCILKHDDWVTKAVFSPDNRYVATAANKSLNIWELTFTEKPIKTFVHSMPIQTVQFSNNGKYLLSASLDSTVCVWNINEAKLAMAPLKHDSGVSYASFTPNNKCIISCSKKYIYLWDARNGMLLEKIGFENETSSNIAISSCGTSILAYSPEKNVCVFNLLTDNSQNNILFYDKLLINSTFSKDGRFVALTTRSNKTTIWDLCTNKQVGRTLSHSKLTRVASLNHNGKFLVTISEDNHACIWNVKNGELLQEFFIEGDKITRVDVDDKVEYMITLSISGTITVWRIKDFEQIKQKMTYEMHDGMIYSVEFILGGKSFITTSFDKTMRIWDTKSCNPVSNPFVHKNGVLSASMSCDSLLWVTTTGNTAHIWSKNDDFYILHNLTHLGAVVSADFSPDAEYIVTASYDNTARVWSTKTGNALITPLRHNAWVEFAKFSNDGNNFYTQSVDGTVRVWPFPPLQELIDKYRNDPEHDWSLSQEEKDEYSLE